MPAVGPSLPPHMAKRKRSGSAKGRSSSSSSSSGSDDDDVGPALPPHLASKPLSGPAAPAPAAAAAPESADAPETKRTRLIGPAMPPPEYATSTADAPSETANADDASSSDDDDDDVFGPTLPPAAGSSHGPPSAPSTTRSLHTTTSSTADPGPSGRDGWMLLPPSHADLSSTADPLRARPKKFASSRPGGTSSSSSSAVASAWSETPEQKLRRLQDEAMGIAPASTGPSGMDGGEAARRGDRESRKRKADREDEERKRETIRAQRGASLYDRHQSSSSSTGGQKGGNKDDDPAARPFDRERDMAVGAVDAAGRRDMVAKARGGFGANFSAGGFL